MLFLLCFSRGLYWIGLAQDITFNPPPGDSVFFDSSVRKGVSSWTKQDRLVMTPYFYWYDVWSQAHLLNPDNSDALTTHPATLTGFSYKSVAWHKTQLRDMEAAGMDIVLPVYWGDPSQLQELGLSYWSYAGLGPLVAARESLLAEGASPPRIGLFYDTTTLEKNLWGEHVDLTTPRGQAWYYESIRDFFSMIPPKHWAMIDQKPIVMTYASSFARDYDQTHVTVAKERFAEDFGGMPFYLIKEVSWALEAEDTYAWGGATGLRSLSVASLGPGYDHSSVPDRDPLVVDREGGEFFTRNWMRLLRLGVNRAMIETWNEFHEGTDIAHSKEYGRHYLELNRQYADLFKSRYVPPPIQGPFSDLSTVSLDYSDPEDSEDPAGLIWLDWQDGSSELVSRGGRLCRRFLSNLGPVSYLYFRVHDSFRWVGTRELEVKVWMEKTSDGLPDLEFDGSDDLAPLMGAYTLARIVGAERVTSGLTQVTYALPEARFMNGQNGGADFRLRKQEGDVWVYRIEVSKMPFASPPYGVLSSATLSPLEGDDNALRLEVRGKSGTRHVVERSSDLATWRPISSVYVAEGQESEFLEVPITQSKQFFRLSPVKP